MALLSLLAFSAVCHAEVFSSAQEFLVPDWRMPGYPRMTEAAPKQNAGKPLPKAVGPLPVSCRYLELETETFESIAKVIGPGQESSPAWPVAEGFPGLCYRSSKMGDSTALLFVWGTNNRVQTIGVFRSAGQLAPGVSCSPNASVNSGLHTPEGLRLGMTRLEVEGLLGEPQGMADGRIGYARRWSLPATRHSLSKLGRTHRAGRDVLQRHQVVMIWFESERVIGFAVEQNTHYE